MTGLDELRKQQVIYEKVYDQKLMDDTVRKPARDELQKNIVKQILNANFIAFADHKITCCKVEELHVLNGTDNLDI